MSHLFLGTQTFLLEILLESFHEGIACLLTFVCDLGNMLVSLCCDLVESLAGEQALSDERLDPKVEQTLEHFCWFREG